MMTVDDLKNWKWDGGPFALSQWEEAPTEIGFYEIGLLEGKTFCPRYGGRAKNLTLRMRMRQHYLHSHNENIKKHRKVAYFRYRALDSDRLTAFVEAVHIAAFKQDDEMVSKAAFKDKGYIWNKRQEWKQHFTLEDDL